MTGIPRRLLVATALASIFALAGCGDDDEDAGPAAIVPAEAPVYLDVSLRPDGEAREDAEAALGTILDTDDPGQRLIELAEREASEEGESFDYTDEVEPWLGEKFAIFLTRIGGETTESKGAFIFESTDTDRALELFRESDDATGKTGEYEGISYEFDDEGDVFGAVQDFIVGGDLAGFKAAVDAADGESLADTEEFTDSLEQLPDDSLATLYVPPERFIEAIDDPEFDPQSRNLVQQALGESGDEPVLGDVTASAEAITVELSAGGGGVETSESGILESLPSEAWLALGLSDIGASIGRGLEQAEKAGVPGLDAEAIREQVSAATGIDLEQDVVGALGDAALFVTGTSPSSLGGALVIESKDPEASAQLLTKVEELITTRAAGELEVEPLASTTGDQGFQVTVPRDTSTTGTTTPAVPQGPALTQAFSVIQRDDRIVVGYGGAAVNQVLAGKGAGFEPLPSNPVFRSARDAVGDLGVDLFVSAAPVLELADAAGVAEGSGFRQAKRYLDALDFVAIGSGAEDERALVRTVIGLER